MISNELNGLESARYDSRNLPYTIEGTSMIYYTYDADGQRVSKKEGSTTTSYIRGADGQTVAVYENGSIDKWNILSGGDVVGTVTSGGSKEYFLKDHLGSTRTVVNTSGTAVAYFDFYPYGKLMPGRYTTSNDDRNKFTGHELDEEAGLDLSYAGARYLDSEIGTWLSIDPMADSYPGWSPYNYTTGNPVNLVDPTGMAPQTKYFIDGELVYDDGQDNGVEVYTTQSVIDDYTSDGETDWDGVRNDKRSNFEITDRAKYYAWESEITNALFDLGYHKVGWNNRATITTLVSVDEFERDFWVNAIQHFFGGSIWSQLNSKRLLYKDGGSKNARQGSRTAYSSDLSYNTVRRAIKMMGGRDKSTQNGTVTSFKKNGNSVSVRNYSSSRSNNQPTLQINTKSGKELKVRLKN